MKYIYCYVDGDMDNKEFDSKEAAIEYGDYMWDHHTDKEKKKCEACYILESANPDEDAENHFDGDILKKYKL